MAPSPGIFLAAVAQRTRRIRFGPLVYLLPLYTPLRLVEEIAMLDQMSGGRFELGVGRGISPYELAYCGVDFLEAPAMYAEALEVILAGLRGGRLTHRGRYYRYLDVPIELTPVQRPHPPLWQGVTSPEGAATAAGRGVNIVGTAPNARMKEVVDRYYEQYPDAIGFINGYGSARTFDLRDGRPFLSYEYYLDVNRPVEEARADLEELIRLNPKRPYFLLMHVRELNTVEKVDAIVNHLSEPVEIVPLDTFLKLAAGAKTYRTFYQRPTDPISRNEVH